MNNNDIINSIRSNNLAVKLSFNNQNSLEGLAGRISSQIDADSISLLKAMTNPKFLSKTGFKNETALGMSGIYLQINLCKRCMKNINLSGLLAV